MKERTDILAFPNCYTVNLSCHSLLYSPNSLNLQGNRNILEKVLKKVQIKECRHNKLRAKVQSSDSPSNRDCGSSCFYNPPMSPYETKMTHSVNFAAYPQLAVDQPKLAKIPLGRKLLIFRLRIAFKETWLGKFYGKDSTRSRSARKNQWRRETLFGPLLFPKSAQFCHLLLWVKDRESENRHL